MEHYGLWMGGFVPLGYDANGRTLQIVESEAKTVRRIFQLYLDLGTVPRVKEQTDRLGIRSKARKSPSKKTCGGYPLSRGHLYKILNNPLYVGRIRHKEQEYPGQHPAIIDLATWEAVQRQLTTQAPKRSQQRNLVDANPLRGKLFDELGHSLTPVHSTKGGRRYRYYISRPSSEPSRSTGGTSEMPRWRLPAREIEQFVARSTDKLFSDTEEIARLLREAEIPERKVPDLSQQVRLWRGKPRDLLLGVHLRPDQITIEVDVSGIVDLPDS